MIEMAELEEIVMNKIVSGGGSNIGVVINGAEPTTRGGVRSSIDSSTTGTTTSELAPVTGTTSTSTTTTTRDDENDILLKTIFRRADLKFDSTKSYTISEVLDTLNDRFVSFKKGQFMGIINLSKNEFVDTRTGIKLDIMTAIRTNKIRLENTSVTSAGVVTNTTIQPSQLQQRSLRPPHVTSSMSTTAIPTVDLNTSNDFENGQFERIILFKIKQIKI